MQQTREQDANLLPRPEVTPHEDSILFLAEHWSTTVSGDLTVRIVRSPGFEYEAEVRRGDDLLLKERLTIKPTITTWITSLLNRAGNGATP